MDTLAIVAGVTMSTVEDLKAKLGGPGPQDSKDLGFFVLIEPLVLAALTYAPGFEQAYLTSMIRA